MGLANRPIYGKGTKLIRGLFAQINRISLGILNGNGIGNLFVLGQDAVFEIVCDTREPSSFAGLVELAIGKDYPLD